MKIRIIAILFILGGALALVGCGGPAPTPETITVVETVVVEKIVEVPAEAEVEEAMGADMSLDPYILALAGYRTGAYQHTGTPLGNGSQDAATLINVTGGVDGWPVRLMEMETGYATPRGVEAYERAKTEGNVVAFYPFSTGTTYAVTPRAFEDKIPIVHTAYGISAAANGETFPYNFVLAPTYWTTEAATTKFIADQVGGEEGLKGQKIAMVYADIDYGRETIPLMEVLAEKFGFELQKFPIEWPGLDQTAAWTDIAERSKPDWIILRMWGQSTVVSLQQAAAVEYPMQQIIGCPWSPTDQDISLAGPATVKGVRANYFTSSGTDIPVIQEILTKVHDTGQGYGPRYEVGTQLYNRGVYGVSISVAAIRIAAEEFGHPVNGEQVKWGFEHITPESIKTAGLTGLVPDGLQTSETDHMGSTVTMIHEFDGEKMVPISEWTTAYEDIVGDLIEEAAAAFKEANPELYE